jgi:hypothetical protein
VHVHEIDSVFEVCSIHYNRLACIAVPLTARISFTALGIKMLIGASTAGSVALNSQHYIHTPTGYLMGELDGSGDLPFPMLISNVLELAACPAPSWQGCC